jgi:hypothetical protein
MIKQIPYELVNLILEYDGQIKYKYKQKNSIDYHKYVNIIHKYDKRRVIIESVIYNKKRIMKTIIKNPIDSSFYFQFSFIKEPKITLCYSYNWDNKDVFEICLTTMKESGPFFGGKQIKTKI